MGTNCLVKKASEVRKAYDEKYKEEITISKVTKPIFLHGEKQGFVKNPFIFSDRLYVPIEIVETIYKKEVTLTEQVLKLSINNKLLIFKNEKPQLINDQLFVPAKKVFKTLNLMAYFNENDKTITISNENTLVQLTNNSTNVIVNGEEITIETAPYLSNGTTFVPVRLISELFGATIDWGKGRTIELGI